MKFEATDGISEIQHTADVSIRVTARSLDQLFIKCARGMYHLAGIEIDAGLLITRRLEISAIDHESLLVAFLSELINFAEDERIAFFDFALELSYSSLKGSMTGSRITCIRKSIKAATFHDLNIRSSHEEFIVTLVFDV